MSTTQRDIELIRALTEQTSPPDPPEWWRSMVLYEVYVRSFNDTDGSGLGDLRGVLERIDYIADLGVDGIWLAPFYASPQEDGGYDISDFLEVDARFGTLQDFRDLLDAAHGRGLKVILDLVLGHTSDRHPWYRESAASHDNPKADWYVWADAAADGGAPNNWLSSFGGRAWRWEPRRAQ
ncbi:MAG: alpha-amylase family glycosyl hydrolase, partial [Roseicyclus sp.]